VSVRIRGDFKKLESLQALLAEAPQLLETMSRQMAEETVGLIKDQHRTETDPYGAGWQPKKVPDRRKILSGKTSRLKNGWHVSRAGKRGFTVAPSVTYAAYHQSGTRRMPVRLLVPTKAKGLPKPWSSAYRAPAVDTLREHFKRAKAGSGSIGSGASRVRIPMSLIRRAFRAAVEST